MKTVDFDRLRKRLRTAREEISARRAAVDHVDPLDTRVAELARRSLELDERRPLDEVIAVRRAGLVLATPTTAVREVRSVTMVALPGSGAVVNGLFQIRGRTSCLIDLAPLFGEAEPLHHGDSTLVMVISGSPGSLGLRIDEVLGPRDVFEDDLDTGLDEQQVPFVSYVTRDLMHVIDVEVLMASPEVRI